MRLASAAGHASTNFSSARVSHSVVARFSVAINENMCAIAGSVRSANLKSRERR